MSARLACLIHAASVHPGPGSNPHIGVIADNANRSRAIYNHSSYGTTKKFLIGHLLFLRLARKIINY